MGCGDSKLANVVEPVRNNNNTYDVDTTKNQSPTPVSAAIDTSNPPQQQHLQQQPQLQSQSQPTPPQQLSDAATITTAIEEKKIDYDGHQRSGTNNVNSFDVDGTNRTETAVDISNENGPFYNIDNNNNNNNIIESSKANAIPEKKLPPVEVGIDDPQWQELWLANKDLLLDPADVHATLQDLMANSINQFSDTEIVFLQRRVRSIIRQSQLQSEQQSGNNNSGKSSGARTMMKKARLPSFSGNSSNHGGGGGGGGSHGDNNNNSSNNNPNSLTLFQELQETTNIAKNRHLLTSYVMRKLLPHPPVPAVKCNTEFLAANFMQTIIAAAAAAAGNNNFEGNHTIVDLSSSGNNIVIGDIGGGGGGGVISTIASGYNDNSVSTIQTTESTYILALFCNDVLWDDVADIAVSSAEINDLEMDVNKKAAKQLHQQQMNNNYEVDKDIPSPSNPTCDRPPELPLGMGMHALTFIFGLALRKFILCVCVCVCVCVYMYLNLIFLINKMEIMLRSRRTT
jgi:hypothetical protein